MVASTMLKGGLSNRTLQYAELSSMTRTCDAHSVFLDVVSMLQILYCNYKTQEVTSR
jgi:hypothetical protein